MLCSFSFMRLFFVELGGEFGGIVSRYFLVCLSAGGSIVSIVNLFLLQSDSFTGSFHEDHSVVLWTAATDYAT